MPFSPSNLIAPNKAGVQNVVKLESECTVNVLQRIQDVRLKTSIQQMLFLFIPTHSWKSYLPDTKLWADV